MPAKFSGAFTAFAMRVIEIVEVFDARMASGGSSFSSSPYSFILAVSFSTMASMTTSRSARALRVSVVLSRASAAARSAGVMRPISMRPCTPLAMVATPFSRAAGGAVEQHGRDAAADVGAGDARAHDAGADHADLVHVACGLHRRRRRRRGPSAAAAS